MLLITKAQRAKLIKNAKAQKLAQDQGSYLDLEPVVKLFTPDGQATWLLTEIDPDNQDLAFGLCDLGYPEFGYVSLRELAKVRGKLGLPIERDRWFSTNKTLSECKATLENGGRL